jgi:outer membrane protein TolC
MKAIIITVIGTITTCFSLFAQNSFDVVLSEVEKNNSTLSALRKQVDAQKTGNKTGIYLPNPEFEFNYLWDNPNDFGNRTDITVTQSFDFPSAYSYKKQITDARNEQVELEYQKQKKAILLQARLICMDLIYINALQDEFVKRVNNAQVIADAYNAKFEKGETNIIENNKAQLNLLNIRKEAEVLEINRNALLSELTLLNGGTEIQFDDISYLSPEIPVDFEQWYLLAEQNNPLLNWLRQEIEINQKQEKLNLAMSLPKMYTGYMSEKIIGQHYQGITLGISIPLWENKNTVKYAKAQSTALQGIVADNKLNFYHQLKIQHARAISLQQTVNDYRRQIEIYDNSVFIEKALQKGEISLTDYILELTNYYGSVNKLLEAELEMNQAIAELSQYL